MFSIEGHCTAIADYPKFLSGKKVKKHLSNILVKLDATYHTRDVDQARRLGRV